MSDVAGGVAAEPVRRAALAFIFVTVVLDMLALGVIVPVLPMLVLDLEGGDSAHAATVYGVFGTVFAAMQFVFAPVLGALSDRFGRRPVILLSNLGLGLDYVVMALAPSVAWLLAGRVVAGICSASFSIPGAYIADVTPPERRAASFGLLSAAFGFGFIVGPAFGGLLGSVDPRWPFWGAAVLSLANAAYGFFILPESLAPERRARFDLRSANPIGALLMLRESPQVLGLAAVSFIANVAHEAQPSTFVLYTAYRFGWDTVTVGWSLAAIGAGSIAVGGWLVRLVVARLGERASLLLGTFFGAAGFAIHGLAPTSFWFCVGIAVVCLWGLARPAAQSLMTQQVDPAAQGRLQGALSAIQGIAFTIGPMIFTGAFAAAVDGRVAWLPTGVPFLLASLLLAGALLVAAWVTRR